MRFGLLAFVVSALAGCQGEILAGPAQPDPPAYAPGPATLPRLTAPQYFASVEDALGPGLPRPTLEEDTNPYLFFNVGAASTTLSEVGAARYEGAAIEIANAALSDPTRRMTLLGCEPAAPGDACVVGAITRVGRLLYRRPLSPDELTRWTGLSISLASGDAARGLRYVLAGLLQAPYFLYRVELGTPDPARPGWRRYGDLEMASRMSFLLWNAGPDDELLDAALAGRLSTADGIHAQALRMLEDPRARRAVRAFFAQYLDLGRLEQIGDRDPMRYPSFTPTMARSMRTEIELLVDEVVFTRDADVREILRTRRTFVNDELAALYGVAAPGADPITFVPVELPEDGPRAGLLTLGTFLTMNAHPTETSPTSRGKYVRERLLCDLVRPPPDDVDTNIPEASPTMPRTLRERLEAHRARPDCAACHAAIDPPGFTFENFDSVGAVRLLDHGVPVDTSGDLDGMPVTDGRMLGELLASDPRVSRCITRQLFRHANARLETFDEEVEIRRLASEFMAGGSRFLDLLLAMVTSDAFRTTRDIPEGGAR